VAVSSPTLRLNFTLCFNYSPCCERLSQNDRDQLVFVHFQNYEISWKYKFVYLNQETLADPDGVFDGSISQAFFTAKGSIRHGSVKLPRVTQLETKLSTTKAVYHKAFITLTNRVKKLESQLKQKRSSAVIYSSDEEGPSVHIEDSLKQGMIIEEMDKDKNINLVSEQGEVQETAEHSRDDDDDETLAETLLNIKRSSTKDKGKGIMQETYLPKKLKKKEMIQLSLDEELT
nr:hypothetical protein [Tanacetum cinerariifolium]